MHFEQLGLCVNCNPQDEAAEQVKTELLLNDSNKDENNCKNCSNDNQNYDSLLIQVQVTKTENGENDINNKIVNAFDEIEIIIQAFESAFTKRHEKVIDHFNELRNQILEDTSLEAENQKNEGEPTQKEHIIVQVANYERKCLNNLNSMPLQIGEIKNIFSKISKRLALWINFVHYTEMLDEERKILYDSAMSAKHMLLNSVKFFNSLLFLGQLPVYEKDEFTSRKKLKYKEFTYMDILNRDRLNANYKPGKIVYNSLAFTPKYLILKTMWMSLIHVDKIVISLQVFNELTGLNEIVMKYFDNNGQLINENVEHKNCQVLSMITSEKYIVFSIEYFDSNANYGKMYSLKLFDLNLCLSKSVAINYKPVLVYQTYCQLYLVTNEAPFIRVIDWNLVENSVFGQEIDSNGPFYLPNIAQVYVRSEKLYVRDHENMLIKVLDLKKGNLIKSIKINLLDCLLHIDSIGRIIVINQDSKILYIFDESSRIQFEYDLTFIQNITSFCVIDNGHLLINDALNKILHVI